MPDNSSDNTVASSLSNLMRQAAGEVSKETQNQIAAHPDLEAVVQKLKSTFAVGKTDAMSPAERAAYKKAVDGADDNAAPAPTTAAATSPTKTATVTPAHDSFTDMLKGVGNVVSDQLMRSYNAAVKEKETK